MLEVTVNESLSADWKMGIDDADEPALCANYGERVCMRYKLSRDKSRELRLPAGYLPTRYLIWRPLEFIADNLGFWVVFTLLDNLPRCIVFQV